MITIEQLLESVDLDFEPRWVTKDESGDITIYSHRPTPENWCDEWREHEGDYKTFGELKLSEFANKHWTKCIYEVPRKTIGKIEKLACYELADKEFNPTGKFEPMCYMELINKINVLVEFVNTLIESNNIHEKQIDELQMKLEPEKCAVNELKGAKNE